MHLLPMPRWEIEAHLPPGAAVALCRALLYSKGCVSSKFLLCANSVSEDGEFTSRKDVKRELL